MATGPIASVAPARAQLSVSTYRMTVSVPDGARTFTAATVDAFVTAFEYWRDATGFGASEIGARFPVCRDGGKVGEISYNGRFGPCAGAPAAAGSPMSDGRLAKLIDRIAARRAGAPRTPAPPSRGRRADRRRGTCRAPCSGARLCRSRDPPRWRTRPACHPRGRPLGRRGARPRRAPESNRRQPPAVTHRKEVHHDHETVPRRQGAVALRPVPARRHQ